MYTCRLIGDQHLGILCNYSWYKHQIQLQSKTARQSEWLESGLLGTRSVDVTSNTWDSVLLEPVQHWSQSCWRIILAQNQRRPVAKRPGTTCPKCHKTKMKLGDMKLNVLLVQHSTWHIKIICKLLQLVGLCYTFTSLKLRDDSLSNDVIIAKRIPCF